MSSSNPDPILTLEPLSEAVRAGVEGAGWTLSGLQKTTSHQFEGRWEGESTRSAYLFFHRPDSPEFVSVDVYLDETSRGVTGNVALVVDLLELGALASVPETLEALGETAAQHLPDDVRRPVTLRFRMSDAGDDVGESDSEVRMKVRLPRRIMTKGAEATTDFVRAITADFGALLDTEVVRRLSVDGE